MAVREELVLDLSRALSQIDDLERELDSLLQPIEIPVQLEADQALDQLRREIRLADTDDIDIDVDSTDLDRAEQELEEMRREANRAEDAVDDLGDEARRSGDDVERLGRRGSGAFRSLGANVGLLLSGVAAFAGAREIFEFFSDSIEQASILEEALSKTRVVFGEFSDDIETFAREAPSAVLLSEQAALSAVSTFGNLFTALGLSQEAAADLSPEIVQLGADLASFNDIEVDEALTALRSGLVGEVEPLRRLGVAINAATVEAKALELGLVGANGEVTEAAKVQARWALILEQTSNAQGDVARTADSIANRQRNLAAEFETVRAEIGDALIPAFERLLDLAPAVIDGIRDGLVPAIAGFSSALADVEVEGFISAIATLPTSISTLATATSSGAQAFGNAFQIFADAALLNFGDLGNQFEQLGEDITSLREAPIANEAIQTLIQTLIAGREPAAALESTLIDLGESVSGLTLDTFEELANQLVIMTIAAGGAEIDLFRLADVVEQLGLDAGFSEEGVASLAEILRGPFLDAAAGVPPPLDEIARAAANADEALSDTETTASGFDLGDVDEEIGGVGEAAQTAAQRLDAFNTELRKLTDPAFAAVRAESDLADAQERVNEVLSDPDATADDRREALIRLAEAQAEVNSTAANLPSNLGPAADAITELLTEAGVEADNIQILIDQLDELDGTTAIANIEIRTTGEFPIDPNVRLPGGLPGAANQPVGQPTTNVTNNFFTEPEPTTDTARVSQSVAAAISAGAQ